MSTSSGTAALASFRSAGTRHYARPGPGLLGPQPQLPRTLALIAVYVTILAALGHDPLTARTAAFMHPKLAPPLPVRQIVL
jgi:hypothetical protein